MGGNKIGDGGNVLLFVDCDDFEQQWRGQGKNQNWVEVDGKIILIVICRLVYCIKKCL